MRVATVGSIKGECVCGTTPCSGLDCGPYLPGRAPRKHTPKPFAEVSAIRKRAWDTRRALYGNGGHR